MQEDTQSKDTTVTSPTGTKIKPLAWLIVGLVIGVLIGYMGRPFVTPQPTVVASATPVSVASPTPAADAGTSAEATRTASRLAIMDAIVAQTRHFKGDPNAPVTIVEFSDFQ